jgi:ribosomal-protein-alanine N-acetyltransferase
MAVTFTFPDDVPMLTDGGVTLRAHRMSDVDGIVEQCVDPESIRWTTVPVPFTREHAVSYVTTDVPEGWRTQKDLNFAIVSTHSDGRRRFSGSISLRPTPEGIAEIAFGLHPGARGHGVCSRAVKLILDWGFQLPNIEVVVWYAYVGNWESWRVAWANGFSFDGKIKKFLPQRGERHDTWCGSLRKDDTREPKHAWHVPPVLESDRLRLRPNRDEDATRNMETMTDERSRHFGGRSPWRLVPRSPAEMLDRSREADAKGERYDWTIADRTTDEFLGHIQIFGLSDFDVTTGELGYSVHPDARGRGVLTDALGVVTEFAFRATDQGGLGLRRLKLGTAASNKASRHAAEKAGFIHVATEPAGFPSGESGFEDETLYHQLNPSWKDPDAHP